MTDLVVGVALVLVFEGLLWAAAPQLAFRMLVAAAQLPESVLRTVGAAAMAMGVVLVWLVRG